MTQQRAQSVVGLPVTAIDTQVLDVTRWPGFLPGLTEVTETSHGRYRFVVSDGRGVREVDVAVSAHPGERRCVWHALSGPRFDGEIHWAPSEGTSTTVSLVMTADPAGLLAGMADLLRGQGDTATIALQRLEALARERTP